jgi:5-formyltetrahydrofolate cyclo-ligase
MHYLNYKKIQLSEMQEQKRKLRIQYNKLLATLSDDIKIKSSESCNRFLIDYISNKYPNELILSFNSMPNELNIREFNSFLATRDQLVLPRVNKITQQLDCYLVPRLTLEYLELSDKFGILEPIPDTCELLDPLKLSLIVVPGLSFESTFNINNKYNRLGRGKGYYDKLLTKTDQSEKIGICFEIQKSKEPLPMENHDQTIDYLYSF